MLQAKNKQAWNKKSGAITVLVAMFGIASVLYTANNLLDEQFVSAVLPKNPLKNPETKIYPWGVNQEISTESPDIVTKVVNIKNRISQIDDQIMQNIKSGIHEAKLFEEKGDLLVELGQYESAVAHYEEAYDLSFESQILDKLLETKNLANKMQIISK